MAHINHPLLGDAVYGPKKKALGVETQMLHAKLLVFITRKQVNIWNSTARCLWNLSISLKSWRNSQ